MAAASQFYLAKRPDFVGGNTLLPPFLTMQCRRAHEVAAAVPARPPNGP